MAAQIITLTSDFGYRDPFVGTMKGVILRINPAATLVDLTHGIEPQDIMGGALSLAAAVPYFQRGTVHMAVVDPGVGSSRKPIVIETADAFYVGPDNGVLSLAARTSHVIRTVQLSNRDYHLKPTSSTFHGRDIFAPAAARIATGTSTQDLGGSVDTFTALDWPAVECSGDTLTGQVVYIDHFGNLISNIRPSDLERKPGNLAITVHETTVTRISASYSSAGQGNYLAIFNSWGLLEVSKCNGNARLSLGAHIGSTVSVTSSGVL
jgi:S-adenosyl-L-methionine hydrolase (adenosine-forming)